MRPVQLKRHDWICFGGAAFFSALAIALLISALTSSGPKADAIAAETTITAGPPPKAEPLVFAPVAAHEARRLNDAMPFAPDRGPQARPFQFAGETESRERAVDCLASAMWYEAGDDDGGQRAVGQVVLNRVRHPAFPRTVCGVVFQGAERATGCQFTFTCDGAMKRVPSRNAFDRARTRARAMLEGAVWKDVGLATHYHTDWVHPVWSARLDKIAQVDTHLFFRWHGGWGGPQAQRQRYQGAEPLTAQLAALSLFHGTALATTSDAGLPAGHARSLTRAPQDLGDGRFQIGMSTGRSGNVQAMAALDLCGDRDFCKVTGLIDHDAAGTASQPVAFLYVRDRQAGVEKALWDCAAFKRPSSAQCFTASNRSWTGYSVKRAGSAETASRDEPAQP
jgi:spore germination cell wall hydrolase CwlJ-like protein